MEVAEVQTLARLFFNLHGGDEISLEVFHGISRVRKLMAVFTGPASSAHAFASNTNTVVQTTAGALSFELTSLSSVGTITEANSATTDSSVRAIVGTNGEILSGTVVSCSPRFTEAFAQQAETGVRTVSRAGEPGFDSDDGAVIGFVTRLALTATTRTDAMV